MIEVESTDRLVRESCARNPEKVLLVSAEGEGELTYRDLDRRVSRAANLLRERGIVSRSTVSLFLRNSLAFFPPWLGTIRAGGVVNPINLGLASNVERIVYMLRKTRAKLFLLETAFRETARAVKEAYPEIPVAFVDADAPEQDFSWVSEMEKAPEAFDEVPVKPDDPFQMIFTSGTTGLPKAVVQRHEMLTDAFSLAEHFGYRADDTAMCVLPLFHVNAQYTSFFPMLGVGGTLVLFEKFSASRFFPTIREREVNHVSVVPSLLTRLLSRGVPAPHEKPDSLKFIVCGAAPLSEEVHREFVEKTGIPVPNGWGMTETGCWGCHMKPDRLVYGSMGRALPINEMRIADPATGEALPADEVGRLLIRGRNVFSKYFDAPDATREAFRFGEGWFDTGDDARVDANGCFWFVGRGSVDTGKVDGEFVNFLTLDEKLWKLNGVAEVCCVGVPDPIRGASVAACVVPRPGADLAETDVIDFCRKEGFAFYEMPQHVLFVEEVPKGDTGKLQRKVMTERAVELLKKRREA